MESDEGLLDAFLPLLPPERRHVLEFRNQTWYRQSIFKLMRRYNVALCVHDMERRESPISATADFTYVRFHGPTGRYAGNYPDQHLQEWTELIQGLASGLKAVYVYFNNDIEGHAVSNAMTLAKMLR